MWKNQSSVISSFFTDIPDPFSQSMRFTKFKNNHDDLVDDVEYLVMHKSQVCLANISSIKLKSTNDYNTCAGVSKIDSHTKYSLVHKGGKHGFYTYNPHSGWNKLLCELLRLLSTVKVDKASLFYNIEIIMNATGN